MSLWSYDIDRSAKTRERNQLTDRVIYYQFLKTFEYEQIDIEIHPYTQPIKGQIEWQYFWKSFENASEIATEKISHNSTILLTTSATTSRLLESVKVEASSAGGLSNEPHAERNGRRWPNENDRPNSIETNDRGKPAYLLTTRERAVPNHVNRYKYERGREEAEAAIERSSGELEDKNDSMGLTRAKRNQPTRLTTELVFVESS